MKTLLLQAADRCSVPEPSLSPENIKKAKAALLPIQRVELDQLNKLEAQHRVAAKCKRLGVQVLDPSIFGWKRKGLPAFSAFSVMDEGICRISSHTRDHYPSVLREHYSRATDGLRDRRKIALRCAAFGVALCGLAAMWAGWATHLGVWFGGLAASVGGGITTLLFWDHDEFQYTITDTFNGFIPASTRAKIEAMKSEFRDILIVKEANWTLKSERIPMPVGDPLVVGVDDDGFYLLDRFDTTSLEQHVADEWANK